MTEAASGFGGTPQRACRLAILATHFFNGPNPIPDSGHSLFTTFEGNPMT
jgi:hypothetical protein